MKIIHFLVLLFLSTQSIAQFQVQEAVSVSGGSFSQAHAKMDYVIGETVIETFKSHNLYLSQGLLQGAETSLNSKEEFKLMQKNILVFPNPFNAELQIQFPNLNATDKAKIIFINQLGQQIKVEENLTNQNKIGTESLPSGIYIAQILINGETMKSIKIQKVD